MQKGGGMSVWLAEGKMMLSANHLDVHMSSAIHVIGACFTLHSICKGNGENFWQGWVEDSASL